ncbi:MAG: hypothetical protein K2G20_00210 [Lachnospiraceae bacterium]|nr:hypothetical protein [Lachnospiraceae bacterium]
MNQGGVPELTPEIEKMAKEALILQFEDQYDVKIIIVEDNVLTETEQSCKEEFRKIIPEQ